MKQILHHKLDFVLTQVNGTPPFFKVEKCSKGSLQHRSTIQILFIPLKKSWSLRFLAQEKLANYLFKTPKIYEYANKADKS